MQDISAGYDLQVSDLVVSRRGKVILDKVSFHICPGTITAMIGPNGAGKTTLMRTLSGEMPDEGQVKINGQDIYQDPEYWLQKIGYVPVDNILHPNLPLQEALVFIGKLRLPSMPLDVIKKRVDNLLTKFDFNADDPRRHRIVKELSSGELKRANICAELIIDPPCLLLDEATSNLDPNAEYKLMRLLAHYAHENKKTVLVITHTLNSIDLCDEVIYIENSRLRAHGPPEAVLNRLETDLGLQTGGHLSSNTFSRWAQVFDETKTEDDKRRPYSRDSRPLDPPHAHDGQVAPRVSSFAQFCYLLDRYMRVRLGDRWSLIGTLMAGFSGVLFFTLPGSAFIRPFDPAERTLALNQARQSVYVISLVVTLLGMITSYTEISKEYRIYSHERLKGLSPVAYFLSKWTWLALSVGVLAPVVLLVFIVLVYQQPFPGFPEPRLGETVGWWEQLISYQLKGLITVQVSWLVLFTLVLCCITSVTLGLFISCIAGDGGKGYLYLSFAVVFVVLFSGLIRNPRLGLLIDQMSYFSTGKWAYEGIASSIGIYCWIDDWRFDEFNSSGHLLSIWLALALFSLALGSLAILTLHLRDPWYAPTKNLRLLIARNRTKIALLLSVLVLLFSNTLFLRSLSSEYHALNYWSREEYGGSNAYQYANISQADAPNWIEKYSGIVSQSWCGNPEALK